MWFGRCTVSANRPIGVLAFSLLLVRITLRRSGDHTQAIRCIKHLEGDGWQAAAGPERDAPTFLFAKCKVRKRLPRNRVNSDLASWLDAPQSRTNFF